MSDDLIRNTTDLGELRAAFLSLKHAQDKQFFVDNFDELLIFAENTPTTLLLEAYVKVLLEYIQRRSGLTDKKINDFIEQSKSKFSMAATAKQTMFDRHEAKVLKKATANALEKARKEVNEAYAQEIQEANTKLQEAKSQAQEAKSQAQEAKSQAQEANRANVIRLIRNIQLTDNQIVESLDLPLTFVQAIRKEITV